MTITRFATKTVAAATLLATAWPALSTPAPYTGFVALSYPPFLSTCNTAGVNIHGHVVGRMTVTNSYGTPMAFVTGVDGQDMRVTEGLPNQEHRSYWLGTAINAHGTVVGEATSATSAGPNAQRAFKANAVGQNAVSLGSLDDPNMNRSASRANAINTQGWVAGESQVNNGAAVHGFLKPPAAAMVDVGVLPGGSGSSALGVNDSGIVVGNADTAAGKSRAFMWQAGTMTSLRRLPGSQGESWATAINSQATPKAVGRAEDALGYLHAVMWKLTGAMPIIDLHQLGTRSSALALNLSARAAGWFQDATGQRAFVTDPGGANMTDLNALTPSGFPSGVTLVTATGISNNGKVAADGDDGNCYLLLP